MNKIFNKGINLLLQKITPSWLAQLHQIALEQPLQDGDSLMGSCLYEVICLGYARKTFNGTILTRQGVYMVWLTKCLYKLNRKFYRM